MAAGSKITPVESVVNLLTKLQAQTQEEGKKEAAAYDKFACFCKEQSDDKLYSITKADEKIALLTAEIKELAGDIVKLNQEITEMNSEVDALEKKSASDKADRDKAYNDYVVLRNDLQGAIAGADEAIELLKGSKAPGALVQEKVASFMELAMSSEPLKASQEQVKSITAFLDEDPKAFEFHSDEVVQQMIDMKKKFQSQERA